MNRNDPPQEPPASTATPVSHDLDEVLAWARDADRLISCARATQRTAHPPRAVLADRLAQHAISGDTLTLDGWELTPVIQRLRKARSVLLPTIVTVLLVTNGWITSAWHLAPASPGLTTAAREMATKRASA